MKRAEAALKSAEAAYDSAEAEIEQMSLDEVGRRVDLKLLSDGREEARDAEDLLVLARNQAVSELSLHEFIPQRELIFVHLFIGVTTAEARSELRLLKRAMKGDRDWKAVMTVLERRFSDRWSKQEKKTHVVEGDADKPVVITYESDDERRARVASILEKAGAIEAGETRTIDPEDDVRGEIVEAEIVE